MLETTEDIRVGAAAPHGTGWDLFRGLRDIHESVVHAPLATSSGELRRLNREAFTRLFEGMEYEVFGEDDLPEEPDHVFVMNHLLNHLDDLLPGCFLPTLDTHFVSARTLHEKRGEAPIRVVRESSPGEHEHRRYMTASATSTPSPRMTTGMRRSGSRRYLQGTNVVVGPRRYLHEHGALAPPVQSRSLPPGGPRLSWCPCRRQLRQGRDACQDGRGRTRAHPALRPPR